VHPPDLPGDAPAGTVVQEFDLFEFQICLISFLELKFPTLFFIVPLPQVI